MVTVNIKFNTPLWFSYLHPATSFKWMFKKAYENNTQIDWREKYKLRLIKEQIVSLSDKSRAMSEMKRERGRFREERLKCQFPQRSKAIKMERGLLDEIIRPSLVSLD